MILNRRFANCMIAIYTTCWGLLVLTILGGFVVEAFKKELGLI